MIFLASSILLFIMVKAYRERYLLLISEIKKKTSVGICGERNSCAYLTEQPSCCYPPEF